MKTIHNQDVRTAACNAGVCHWQIADAMGVHENTFSRMMRHELPEDKKKEVFNAIERIKEGK